MGALTGTVSYTLFHVDGEIPDDWRELWMERIVEFSFQPLRPELEEDSSVGWCVMGDLLNTDFNDANVLRGEYLCLGMRRDAWSLPPALLKAHIAERSEQHLQEHGLMRLSRLQRDQISEAVIQELKKQALPSANSVDMVWNLDSNVLRFWSQSGSTLERFYDLFESTFNLRLVPSSAYVAAINLGLSEELIGELSMVEQELFADIEGE